MSSAPEPEPEAPTDNEPRQTRQRSPSLHAARASFKEHLRAEDRSREFSQGLADKLHDLRDTLVVGAALKQRPCAAFVPNSPVAKVSLGLWRPLIEEGRFSNCSTTPPSECSSPQFISSPQSSVAAKFW